MGSRVVIVASCRRLGSTLSAVATCMHISPLRSMPIAWWRSRIGQSGVVDWFVSHASSQFLRLQLKSKTGTCSTVYTGKVLCAPPMLIYLSSRHVGHNPNPSTTDGVSRRDGYGAACLCQRRREARADHFPQLTIDRVTQKSVNRTLMRFFGHNLVSSPSLPIRLIKLSDTPISVYDPKACKCGLVRVL